MRVGTVRSSDEQQGHTTYGMLALFDRERGIGSAHLHSFITILRRRSSYQST